MSSKLKSRNLWVSSFAFIAMVVIFITTYDWASKNGAADEKAAVQTTEQSTPAVATAPVPAPSAEPAPVTNEPEAVVVSEPEPPREVTYEEAETAFLERRYDEALELFTVYTDRKNENPWGHYMLGLSAWKAGDHGNAETAFTRALELDQLHVKSWINLSRVLLDTSRPAEALAKIDSALEIDPESNDTYRLRGRAFYQLRKMEDAADAYRHAIQIDDQDAWSMNNLALIYIEEERFEEALPALARAIELREDVPVFYNNLGMALERTGRFRAAEKAYQTAVNIDGSHEKSSANLMRVEAVLEEPGLDPVDLEALAQSFVNEIGSWSEEAVASVQPEAIEPETVDAVIIDADSTESGGD